MFLWSLTTLFKKNWTHKTEIRNHSTMLKQTQARTTLTLSVTYTQSATAVALASRPSPYFSHFVPRWMSRFSSVFTLIKLQLSSSRCVFVCAWVQAFCCTQNVPVCSCTNCASCLRRVRVYMCALCVCVCVRECCLCEGERESLWWNDGFHRSLSRLQEIIKQFQEFLCNFRRTCGLFLHSDTGTAFSIPCT